MSIIHQFKKNSVESFCTITFLIKLFLMTIQFADLVMWISFGSARKIQER